MPHRHLDSVTLTTNLHETGFETMFICTIASNLLLTLLAPAAALSPADTATLHASFDPSLGALRAGRVEAPVAFGMHERSELAAAQDRSRSLAALRGGFEPSNDEWKWLAIGAGVVLVLVLI
jgi:hypothetical protein